jgi:thiamine-phosphate pyrophosphorylase
MKPPERRGALERARLYLVAPGEFPADLLESVVAAGVDVVQLRMKDAEAAEILEIGERFRAVCERAGVPFVVNDRPDVALALDADGVHLGQDDLPPSVARRIVGPDVLIGRSTHSREDIERARAEHGEGVADYIAVGPLYETPTKPGRPAVGPDLLAYAARRVPFPWFAIGGINATNVAGVVATGASRIVVVRAITEAADPIGAVEALRRALG